MNIEMDKLIARLTPEAVERLVLIQLLTAQGAVYEHKIEWLPAKLEATEEAPKPKQWVLPKVGDQVRLTSTQDLTKDVFQTGEVFEVLGFAAFYGVECAVNVKKLPNFWPIPLRNLEPV